MAANKKHDAFLSSMTFASGDISCECDECGLSDDVPSAIRNAVMEHQRKRKAEQLSSAIFNNGTSNSRQRGYNIQQSRELVKRECGFSIWKLCLPCCVSGSRGGSDPLVEYRNQHRSLFIKQLDKVCECCIEKYMCVLLYVLLQLLSSFTSIYIVITNIINRTRYHRLGSRRE